MDHTLHEASSLAKCSVCMLDLIPCCLASEYVTDSLVRPIDICKLGCVRSIILNRCVDCLTQTRRLFEVRRETKCLDDRDLIAARYQTNLNKRNKVKQTCFSIRYGKYY